MTSKDMVRPGCIAAIADALDDQLSLPVSQPPVNGGVASDPVELVVAPDGGGALHGQLQAQPPLRRGEMRREGRQEAAQQRLLDPVRRADHRRACALREPQDGGGGREG